MATNTSKARFLSSFEWTKEREGFGGYSAISLSRDGADFVILSDRGHVIKGSILRHNDRILGVRSQEIEPLGFPDSLFPKKPRRDSEGLAFDGQGRMYISLESENRIVRQDTDGSWSLLPEFPEIQALPKNRGLEALAVAQDGTVFALPETSNSFVDPFPVFRYREDLGWTSDLRITRSAGLVPVGVDFDPFGRLYVLERGFSGFGFYSRVRRFDLQSGPIMDGETLLATRTGTYDNLEGLSVWETRENELRMTMISDDNFNSFQTTEIVEFAVLN